MDYSAKEEIIKIALQNAIEHNGKAINGVVLSKTIAIKPELKNDIKKIIEIISKITNKINKLNIEEQKHQIKKYNIIMKKVKKNNTILPELNNINGEIITRFAPEPNGYLHIGHAKAAIINEQYAKMYNGKTILRLDDTNPNNERLEYYDAIKTDLIWLGIKYNVIKNSSDDIELMYSKCRYMIKHQKAYICTCTKEEIHNNRYEKIKCKCSFNTIDKNYEKWKKMFSSYEVGEAVVRIHGDMKSNNTVMRDPVLFRIIDEKHPILKKKYRVWPSYDFSIAIEDSIDGITHVFRTKEYELRNELYRYILKILNMRIPHILEFSRLELEGIPVSKRQIKELIDNKKINGYDDPRLATLKALKRKGIKAESIRKFTLSLRFTKANTIAPINVLESINRKTIDKNSIRLNMIEKPQILTIQNCHIENIEINNHQFSNLGKRKIEINGIFYVSYDDVKTLKINDKIRLIGLCNVCINTIRHNEIICDFIGNDIKVNFKKIQWVSHDDVHKLEILVPHKIFLDKKINEKSLEVIKSYTEKYYVGLKKNTLIQFIRFGYCKKESDSIAIFTHR